MSLCAPERTKRRAPFTRAKWLNREVETQQESGHKGGTTFRGYVGQREKAPTRTLTDFNPADLLK